MRRKRKQQGFTLLEIMLVVSIIVIILGVAISKLGNTTAIAKSMRVQADVQALNSSSSRAVTEKAPWMTLLAFLGSAESSHANGAERRLERASTVVFPRARQQVTSVRLG